MRMLQCEPNWLRQKLLLAGSKEARKVALELVLLVALPVFKGDSKCAVALFDALFALAPEVRTI